MVKVLTKHNISEVLREISMMIDDCQKMAVHSWIFQIDSDVSCFYQGGLLDEN